MAMAEPIEYGPIYNEPRGTCPKCQGAQVRHLVIGLVVGSEGPDSSPLWVDWVGCVHPGHDRECESCGHQWTADTSFGEPRGLLLELGQNVESKGKTLKVSELDVSALPKIRTFLIDVARRGDTVTYGDVVAATGITHLPRGLGRLMDLLSEDCFLTDEPSLAALVVNQSTSEVGDAFAGDAPAERDDVYEYWAD